MIAIVGQQYARSLKITVHLERTFYIFFFQLTQTAGESIGVFVTTLRLRAKSCQFGDQEESLIRDSVVIGCADMRVQERLLRESHLSLQKAIDICRAAEASRDQMKVLQASTTSSASSSSVCVDHMRSSSRVVKSSTIISYGNCGREHALRSCPAYEKTCRGCNKMDRFEEVCRSSRLSNQHHSSFRSQYEGRRYFTTVDELCSNDDGHQEHSSLSDMNELTLSLDTFKINNCDTWYQELSINGSLVNCKLDSGAQANVIHLSIVQSLKQPVKVMKTAVRLRPYGSTECLLPVGVTTLNVWHKGQSYSLEFYVVDVCMKLDLIRRIDSGFSHLQSQQIMTLFLSIQTYSQV